MDWINKTWINKTWSDKTWILRKSKIKNNWPYLISFPSGKSAWKKAGAIGTSRKPFSYLVINPCYITPCFINPVHVLPIQSSPYFITCEIKSDINGIGNVTCYWVSSWDSWLLLSYLSWILSGVFCLLRLCGSLWDKTKFSAFSHRNLPVLFKRPSRFPIFDTVV